MKRSLYILISCLMVTTISRSYGQASCTCDCLKPVFDYLVESNKLFTYTADNKILVSKLMSDATAAGYAVPSSGCDILTNNKTKYFYGTTTATSGTQFKAQFGDCSVILKSPTGKTVNFLNLIGKACDTSGKVSYLNGPAPVHKRLMVTRSIITSLVYTASPLFPGVTTFPSYVQDSTSECLRIAGSQVNNSKHLGHFQTVSTVALDSAKNIPDNAQFLKVTLHFFPYPGGYEPQYYPGPLLPITANPAAVVSSVYNTGTAWDNSTPPRTVFNRGGYAGGQMYATSYSQDLEADMTEVVNTGPRGLDGGFKMIFMSFNSNVRNYPADTAALYYALCSEKYPDPAKRPYVDVTWTTHLYDTLTVAQLYIDSCLVCKPVTAGVCYSAITDTSVNPNLYGIEGNWRPLRSFVYYGPRNESDPDGATNIRTNGTLQNFTNFWQLKDNVWVPQDTAVSKWVWNSETTLFNEKGAEMENKDPLGRYNAGLYGYGNALATAAVQNARYREIAFEGFEDYNFSYGDCITCKPSRNFDFSSYKSNFDSTEQHTGKYSLRVNAGKNAGISAVVAVEKDTFNLAVNQTPNNCNTNGDKVLGSIRAGSDALLPTFSPIAGKKMLLSVWVKESGQCTDSTYSGTKVTVNIGRKNAVDTAIAAKPGGNIIEGWQRYEMVVTVPANATTFTVYMQNTGNNTVYFDDLRLHPYNANMRSYVYDEVSLRLMAELDENNYAAFYEYDEDGSLVRIKKETERGIMTIKESRSGLLNK